MANDFTRAFTVVGDKELEAKFQGLQKRIVNEGARKAVRAGSTPMLQAMRGQVPKGPSGNLKKSLKRKIKRNPKMPGNPYTANIFVAAPHAHLVRFGTQGKRRPKKRGAMSNVNRPYAKKGYAPGPKYFGLKGGKGTFFGKSVAPMPPNTFFQQVYEAHKGEFLKGVEDSLRQTLLEKA